MCKSRAVYAGRRMPRQHVDFFVVIAISLAGLSERSAHAPRQSSVATDAATYTLVC
jgi:hypothetical protein